MNNMIQSFTRFMLYIGIVISLVSVTSGCSLVSKKEKQVTESKKSESWYECAIDKSGNGWDCGSSPKERHQQQKMPEQNNTSSAPVSSEPEAKPELEKELEQELEPELGAELEQEPATELKSNAPAINEKPTAIYTIQVGAFAGETKRDNFIEDNTLQDLPLALYESIKEGRTWWVLTYGEFSNIKEAKAADDELGNNYGLSDTWIRPLDQLRANSGNEFSRKGTVSGSEAGKNENQLASESAKDKEDFYDPHYSIQLAAFKTEQKRSQFVVDKGLSELELIYAREGRMGETWWIALYGEFEFVKDARVKQAEIEEEFGLSGTWIKPVENN